jgi:PAS domain S-box-containing protein
MSCVSEVWAMARFRRSPPASGTTFVLPEEGPASRVSPLDHPTIEVASGHDALGAVMRALLDPVVILKAIRDVKGQVVDFEIVEANEPALVYNHTSRLELIGARLLERYPSQAASGLFQRYVHTVETGESLILDGFVNPQSASKTERHLDIRVVCVGGLLGCTWRDVTSRERLLEQYQLLAENISDVVFRIGPDLRFEWLSPSVEQSLGYKPEELVGTYVFDLRHPDDDRIVREQLELMSTEERSGFEARVRRADGQYRWISVSGRRMVDSDNVTLGFVGAGRDVQAEHASRKALEDTESRYRLLAENSSDVVSVGDSNGELTWVSDAVTALLGWRPLELSGQKFRSFIHQDDVATYDQLWSAPNDTGHHIYTIRLRTSTGAYRWVSISVNAVLTSDQVPLTRVATWRDASQEVESRRALEESETRYRLLAQNASDIVWQTDLAGRFVWISSSIKSEIGWEPAELIGTEVLELCASGHREQLRAVVNRALEGEAIHSLEFQFRTPSGDLRWMSMHLVPIRDQHGQITGLVSGLRDATNQVEARQTLAESESRFRLLAENASDLVMLVDNDFNIEWISPSVESVLGWSPSELVGTSSWRLIQEDDRAKVEGSHLNPITGISVVNEMRLMKSDGSYLWMSGRSRVTRDDNGVLSGRIVANRDVSQEVEAREALAASEVRYRLLAENATDIVYEVDAHGVIQWISPSIQKVLGYSPSALIGQPSITMVCDLDAEGVVEHRRQLFRGDTADLVERRYVDTDGGIHWMSVSAHPIRGRSGAVASEVVGLRSIDVEVAAREAVVKSEARYRLLAEHASDVIVQTDQEGMVSWVSPSIIGVLGWQAQDLTGTLVSELIFEEDRPEVLNWWPLAFKGERIDAHEARFRMVSGEAIWMSVDTRPVRDEDGKVASVILSLRNVQTEVLVRRAVATLSSGSRVMVHADNELQLLNRMCEVAADDGGYRLAWYGRKVNDANHGIEVLAMSRNNRRYLDELEVTWADEPLGRGPTGTAVRTGEVAVIDDFRTEANFGPWLGAALENGMHSSVALPVRIDGVVDGALTVYAAEPNAFDSFTLSILEDLAAELGHGLKRLRDQEKLVQSLKDHQLLTSAIDQAGEAIVVSDPHSNIVYANPATVRNSGYSLDELIGANPRIFQSGLQSRKFYDEMWANLTAGQSWRGVLANRTKNGEIYEEDTTISPIHDAHGVLIAYVAVKHDLTRERRLEADLSREQSDRDTVIEVMREVRPAKTLEIAADSLCQAVVRLAGIDAVALLLTNEQGELTEVAHRGPLAFNSTIGPTSSPGFREHAQRIRNRPMLLSLDPEDWPTDDQLLHAALAAGLCGMVAAPIRWEGRLIGVLILATRDSGVASEMPTRFVYFEEFASYAGSLVGVQALAKLHRAGLRNEVLDIIEHHRFHPVFQPFVELASGQIVGYEALTRFDDGRRPDLRFADAHEVGLGTELEAVCVGVALKSAGRLDSSLFLSVNFSPAAILDGHAKRALAGIDQRIVIEITEHAPIADYAAVRKAMDQIKGCQLAVDDAGAGYTSLRHILELRPNFVKLDISIVRDIDTNLARQAMAAGMCHFAAHDGTVIIAEGIETEAEAETLRKLGVTLGRRGILGQGFFFARPGPLQPRTESFDQPDE